MLAVIAYGNTVCVFVNDGKIHIQSFGGVIQWCKDLVWQETIGI